MLDAKLLVIILILCIAVAGLLVMFLRAVEDSNELADKNKKLAEDRDFHRREAAEINAAYRQYMSSIEVMVKNHSTTVRQLNDEINCLRAENRKDAKYQRGRTIDEIKDANMIGEAINKGVSRRG